jgi:hypothetical protein
MRVMCDTNILVREVISPRGPAAELVRLIACDHLLVTSLYVLSELYDVLRRPKIRKLHRLRDVKIRRVVSRFYTLATVVPLPTPVPIAVPPTRRTIQSWSLPSRATRTFSAPSTAICTSRVS